MMVRRLAKANWYTKEGVGIKRAHLEKKGIPNMRYWRFITLTLDPKKFENQIHGYLDGKDHMRRFLESLRHIFGCFGNRWCWKLEFHENGWAHWHLCFEYKKKLSHFQMREVEASWGLGFVKTKMVRNGTLAYMFKYVTKDSFRNNDPDKDETDLLPQWFLDYCEPQEGGLPCSFARVRFWQASEGFYTGEPALTPKAKKKNLTLISRPVRSVIRDAQRKVRVVARSRAGVPVRSTTLTLKQPWYGGTERHMAMESIRGNAAPLSEDSYSCTTKQIRELCQHRHQIPKLHRVARKNRLNHQREAAKFQDQILLAQGIPF